jgi:hypothetical protein
MPALGHSRRIDTTASMSARPQKAAVLLRRSALPLWAKSGRQCFITTDPPVWQSLSDVAVAAHI